MENTECKKRIKELEDEIAIMRERYRILVETTPSLLFEYVPNEDKMIFYYNFPNDKSKREICNYKKFVKVSPIVHPDHLTQFMAVLSKACLSPVRGELDYLSKISGDEYQWHRTYYSSIADDNKKVISVLGRIHNIHKVATDMRNMMYRVETDGLTGLYNKIAATEKITMWLKKNSTREAHMLVMDLDNFKKINDRYGHSFGDEMIAKVAKIILKCFDESNSIAARFGGDEYLLFVKDETIRDVQRRVDNLMSGLEVENEYMEEPLQCSIGISVRISRDEDFEDLFNRADSAMYRAKNAGKNQYYIDK